MIGAGYVGLVSAACFSEFGWNVACVDKDASRIEQLRQGRVPIYEPRLDELLERNLRMGRIRFTTDLADAVWDADLVFLAVGTPMRRGDGHADLTFVFQAVEDLAPHLNGFTVIATKSTVPVGTSREIERRLRGLRPDADFALCSNPEFLREGSAIYDFTHPDRVLVGCDEPRAQALMERLYKPLALRNAPVMFVARESAELAKYAANAFLAMKISFINEIADLCEAVEANVQEVATAIGADGRIGDKFLHPGPGYGGSCFPKDVAALVRTAREARSPLSLIEQVQTVNSERKIAMASRMGAVVRAYDPEAAENAKALLPDVIWCKSPLEAAEQADAVVVLTEWNEFRALDLELLRGRMRGDVLVDLRNVYLPAQAQAAGFTYVSIGR
jgi:UDPglucose 6-dehydrogenase